MEAIAAISSIAGILSLLGQAIDSTTKLRNFLSEVSSASETASQLLHDLDCLLQTLDAVTSLVKLLPLEFKNPSVVSLHLRIQAYTKDVFNWFKVAKDIRPAQDGTKAWFKKLWVATNIKSIRDIRDELDRHKHTISLDLTIIGRYVLHFATPIFTLHLLQSLEHWIFLQPRTSRRSNVVLQHHCQ